MQGDPVAAKYNNGLHEAACDAILEHIPKEVTQGNAAAVNNLAEAFAWLVSQNQSHGGGPKPSK